MHTFGHACRIDEIAAICKNWNLILIEDPAEYLRSTYKDQMLGTFGNIAAFSLNGNKTITAGGGGMIIAKDKNLLQRAKHIAKIPHPYEFTHDEIGYNFRMLNLNATLGCAQLEQMERYLKSKRNVALNYKVFFENRPEIFINEIKDENSNFWLNRLPESLCRVRKKLCL